MNYSRVLELFSDADYNTLILFFIIELLLILEMNIYSCVSNTCIGNVNNQVSTKLIVGALLCSMYMAVFKIITTYVLGIQFEVSSIAWIVCIELMVLVLANRIKIDKTLIVADELVIASICLLFSVLIILEY